MPADRIAGAAGLAGGLRRYLSFEKRSGDNPWLDLLRCAAIGFVLARHGPRAWVEANGIVPGWFDFILLNGWFGVDLFFVLSGYLIAGILIRSDAAGFSRRLPVYLWRRALRILPAYYAVLLLTVLGAFPLYTFPAEEIGRRLLYHLLMLQDYFPSDINVVFWTLAAEIQFYLMAPLIVALAARMRSHGTLLCLLGALVLVSTATRWGIALHRGIPDDYAAFWPVFRQPLHAVGEPLMLGVGAALLESRRLWQPSPRVAEWLLAGAAATVAVLAASHEFMARITLYDIVAQPLVIALLFALAVTSSSALSPVRMPCALVARIGARLAYTLYLTHYAFLPLSFALVRAFDGTAVTFWTVFLGLSTASALAVHYLFEKPFLAARRALEPNPAARRPLVPR